MIKVNILGKGVSQYLALMKKLGNERQSLNGTNMIVLLILAGDMETNLVQGILDCTKSTAELWRNGSNMKTEKRY